MIESRTIPEEHSKKEKIDGHKIKVISAVYLVSLSSIPPQLLFSHSTWKKRRTVIVAKGGAMRGYSRIDTCGVTNDKCSFFFTSFFFFGHALQSRQQG